MAENPSRTAEHRARTAQRELLLGRELSAIFSSPAEIVLEIGCGHGHFLTSYAAVHPEKICVGVDIIRERIQRAVRKRDRAKLAHLYFLLADASQFLAALPSGVSFGRVFVLFPDPWPKRRHHKNRLIHGEFLDALAARMAPGGRIYFRTDHEAYFNEAESVVSRHWAWEIMTEPWPFEMETVFQARAHGYRSLVATRITKS